MNNSNNPTKRSPKNSSNKQLHAKPAMVPNTARNTPHTWLVRWQLALSLKDRLAMINGGGNSQTMMRLASSSASIQELIQRYSNDTML